MRQPSESAAAHTRKTAQALTSFRSPWSSCTIVCWYTSTFGCVRIYRQFSPYSERTNRKETYDGDLGLRRARGTEAVARGELKGRVLRAGVVLVADVRARVERAEERVRVHCACACVAKGNASAWCAAADKESAGRTLGLDLDEPEEGEALFLSGELRGGLLGRRSVRPSGETYQNHAEYRRRAIRHQSPSCQYHYTPKEHALVGIIDAPSDGTRIDSVQQDHVDLAVRLPTRNNRFVSRHPARYRVRGRTCARRCGPC